MQYAAARPIASSLKAFGRRPRCKPHRCDRPASETLNTTRHRRFVLIRGTPGRTSYEEGRLCPTRPMVRPNPVETLGKVGEAALASRISGNSPNSPKLYQVIARDFSDFRPCSILTCSAWERFPGTPIVSTYSPGARKSNRYPPSRFDTTL